MTEAPIREIAEIRVRPEDSAAFVAAVEEAVPLFRAAEGCLSMRLDRVVEDEGLFRLVVLWRRIEDHTETFRESDGFRAWRALVGSFFLVPPRVDHGEEAVAGF